jgi:hypothetical protein
MAGGGGPLPAVAIALGKELFGHPDFKVSSPRKVGYCLGEGPLTAAINWDKIVAARGTSYEQLSTMLHLMPDIPKIGNQHDMMALRKEIIDHKLEVVFLDCLYAGVEQNVGEQAGNMFVIGGELKKLTEIGTEADCTFVLLHHFPGSKSKVGKVPEIADLSHAGTQQWARGSILLNRREAWGDDGTNQLYMAVATAGNRKIRELDIDEGCSGSDTWNVTVMPYEKKKTAKQIVADDKKHAVIEHVTAAGVEGIHFNALAKCVDIGRETLKKLLLELVAEKKIAKSPKTIQGKPSFAYHTII